MNIRPFFIFLKPFIPLSNPKKIEFIAHYCEILLHFLQKNMNSRMFESNYELPQEVTIF